MFRYILLAFTSAAAVIGESVFELHPLREKSVSDDTFVLVSEIEYVGPVDPRISCFDVEDDKSITISVVSSNHDGTFRTIKWVSETLTRTREAKTFKCFYKFCSNDTDSCSRRYERLIRVNGLNKQQEMKNSNEQFYSFCKFVISLELFIISLELLDAVSRAIKAL